PTLETIGGRAAAVYPRSSLKPFQASVAIAHGARLDPVQRVLACASHAGTDRHVAVVARTLAGAGLDASYLGCPAAAALDQVTAATASPSRVRMNCSGKHAAFLAACVAAGWDAASYLDPEHPLQRAVLTDVERLCDEPVLHTGVDGCGAPALALTLPGVARGAARLLGPSGTSTLVADVREHPWAIDGPGRANTRTIEVAGAFAKAGAEGFLLVVAPDGTSVAVRVLDGSQRVTTLVALQLLVRVGALPPEPVGRVLAELAPPALGGDRAVGTWRLLV
ncbi:MAG TPA: asparaginase, partial [Actinotalea sp.]|nr:asparaginase [Actinotalea sp.]